MRKRLYVPVLFATLLAVSPAQATGAHSPLPTAANVVPVLEPAAKVTVRTRYAASPIGQSALVTMQRHSDPRSLIRAKAKPVDNKGDDTEFDLQMKSKLKVHKFSP